MKSTGELDMIDIVVIFMKVSILIFALYILISENLYKEKQIIQTKPKNITKQQEDTTLIKQIKDREGFSAFAYKCPAGQLTIGFGINIDERTGQGIDSVEAEFILKRRIKQAELKLKEILTEQTFNQLNIERKRVLIQMIFILGENRFIKFDKMIKHIKNKNYTKASKEMVRSKLNKQIAEIKEYSEIFRKG